MNDRSSNTPARILYFTSAVEFGTGLALIFDPALVVKLLLGAEVSGAGVLLGRCFGVALLALAVACWPCDHRFGSATSARRAMLIYNTLLATYLAYLGTAGGFHGPLLWPAVVLHAVVALLLIGTWRLERRSSASPGTAK